MSLTHILALDASSQACSVALWSGTPEGQISMVHRWALVPRQHTQKLLPMVDEVLNEAGCRLKEVDAFAYGHGPGSFTGIRVASGIVQGLAMGANKPLLGVSTLEALALQGAEELRQHHPAVDGLQVLAALDARMGELYVAPYRVKAVNGWITPEPLDEERVLKPDTLILPEGEYRGIGAGLNYLADFPHTARERIVSVNPTAEPDAYYISLLAAQRYFAGEARPPEEVQPVYLRNNVASRSTRDPLG
ncbi:tRNA threonylcarbamoyladenosine biosynthesis protein TsaB [Halomonadaceae bacterium LMG 33818]|uniref:tRNA (adenosine(37)-N6)-threonylcarbamoyltransferase complex dimerization subunit type 1 TsaB n=1 Tax=Cernens ardua TaxID=3402176 RepID=UPI003EDC60CE